MDLNLSKANQRLLQKRRAELLDRQTPSELRVAELLKEIGERALPQKGFYTKIAHFIIDFYIPKRGLCLEVDGPIHDRQKDYDKRRDKYLVKERKLKVARITNDFALSCSAEQLKQIISSA